MIENYYQQFEEVLRFNFTRASTIYTGDQIECFLACSQDTNCIGVVTQETNQDNTNVKMDNSLSECSSPLEALICLQGKLKSFCNGVFSKWSRTFIEFREFRESEKSLRHELGSV